MTYRLLKPEKYGENYEILSRKIDLFDSVNNIRYPAFFVQVLYKKKRVFVHHYKGRTKEDVIKEIKRDIDLGRI